MFVRIEPVHMTTKSLGMSRTQARVAFKQNAGQNNHFLITVLFGLDAVKAGDASLSGEFSTSWSPQDVSRSAVRSREYALVTSLAWITDLVDVYRKQIQGLPSVIDETVSARINKIDGRANRLAELASVLKLSMTDRNLAMMLFATRWRNTIIHSDADTRLGNDLRRALVKLRDALSLEHRGLDITRSIASYERGDAPTFKEVASFIAAGQQLVETLDQAAVAEMVIEQYAESALCQHFSDAVKTNPQVFSQFWPGNPAKTYQRITQLLTQLGFTSSEPRAILSSNFLDEASRFTASEARARFIPPESP